MHLVLVAAKDFDILRSIVEILPKEDYKPLATRSADQLVEKLQSRNVPLAVVHESFMGPRTVEYCAYLRQALPGIQTIYLRDASLPNSVHPADTPFEPPGRTLIFPCAPPILSRAMSSLLEPEFRPPDLTEQTEMLNAMSYRLDEAIAQNHYQRLFCAPDAPHYALVEAFDYLTNEFHPDRFRWVRNVEPMGADIYALVNEYYKCVVESWNVLKNRTSRREYDQQLGIR